MSDSKSLLKNTFIYSIGTFGSKALVFLLLPLYSYYLSTDEFGLYDLFISAISFFIPVLTLQTSESVYRWLIDSSLSSDYKSKIITNGLAITLFSSLVFVVLFSVFYYFYNISYPIAFLFLLLTSSFAQFFQFLLRGLHDNKLFSIVGLVNTLFILVLNILFLVKIKMGIEGLFLATIIANIISTGVVFIKKHLYRYISFRLVDIDLIKSFLLYSLPLVPNTISWWLINIGNKFIIARYLTLGDNGIYAVSTRLSSLVFVLNSIFMLAWQDHTLKAGNSEKDIKFRSNIFNGFVSFELSVITLLIGLTPLIIKYIISGDYFDAWMFTPFLYLGALFSALSGYVGLGFQREKKTNMEFYTTLVGGVVNIIISVLLIKYIGLYATAIGTFIGFVVTFIVRKIKTDKFYKINIEHIKVALLMALSIEMIFINYIDNLVVKIVNFVLVSILLIFINRKMIDSFLKKANNIYGRIF